MAQIKQAQQTLQMESDQLRKTGGETAKKADLSL